MNLPARYFRVGVGAVIVNAKGAVLALERAEIPGAWQLPQGGWEADETLEEAVYREVEEETGLTRGELELVGRHSEPLAYELPPEWRTSKTGMGQVHYWFRFKLRRTDMNLTLPADGEFRAWSWMPMEKIVETTAPFRRGVYRRIAEGFRLLDAPP
jgi:putative (di)nucleoside polyphosphate hydrolase